MEDNLYSQQLTLEAEMLSEAKRRLASDNTKAVKRNAWSESKIGRVFATTAAKAFTDAVDHFVNQPEQSGRSHNRAARMLKQSGLEPAVISHLFVKGVYNAMPLAHRKRIKRVSLCIRCADLLHDEMRIRFFASEDNRRNLLKKLFKTFDKRTYPREWRKRTILNYFHAEQIDWQKWETKEKLAVGYALLVLFRNSTGLVDAKRESKYVEPTADLVAAFEKAVKDRPLDFMIYKPMVVKPKPWTTEHLYRGGYLTNNVRKYPLIKGSRRRDVDRLLNMNLSTVIPAVNALQETGWRVNKTILEALQWAMFDKGGNIAGLPRANPEPLPPAPAGYNTDDSIRQSHNQVCFQIHSANREIISKRMAVFATVAIGTQYRNFRSIYFPHNLDSRGRAYPLPAFLNPQGPDYVKALLEFSEGKPIATEEDACWLAISGANAYGNDKVSLQERVNWVQDNEEMIFSIGRNYKDDIRWTEAGEPFQFLRFCIEWTNFWSTGYGYVSHAVVPVDATCSGLQHYSAMLRDEVGGRSVNLQPGLPRQDIYQDVADKVIGRIMGNPTEVGLHWLTFGIDRKTTKRQVMVVPYAGTFSSCMEYTREAVTDKLKAGYIKPWADEEHTEHIVYLSKLIWEAIDDTVIKGKQAMKWLSDAAREYTKWANKQDGSPFDKRMSWVTPDGFEAVHYRVEEDKKQIETYLDGKVQLTYYAETDRLSAQNMALAVAPNFVHSLDACLLRMSINKAVDKRITSSFAMIHDSFGVHACDMNRFLHECIKPAFIEMYQNDVLQEFADRLPDCLHIPPHPDYGSLDLDGVQQSEFFFS